MIESTEYEVKVALAGDTLILVHENENGTITVERDSEEFTTTDAVRDLLDNLYGIDVEFVYSADVPGGHLYRVIEKPQGEPMQDPIVRKIQHNMDLLAGPEIQL